MVLDLKDKITIEKLYRNGVDAKEISKRINKSTDAIRKYIQRNLTDLKSEHDFENQRTKEILKKTMYECSQEISNINFYKSNRSIYKQSKKNGDCIINKKISSMITFDTPKRIKKIV